MAHVYLLHDAVQPLFKLGTSVDTEHRAHELIDPIDWEKSRQVRFISRAAALKTEKFLHFLLADHRVPKAHKLDGYTEWFAVSALPLVMLFFRDNKTLLACSNIALVPLRRQAQFDLLISRNRAVAAKLSLPTREAWEVSPSAAFDQWLLTRDDVRSFTPASINVYQTSFRVWLRFLKDKSINLFSVTEETVRLFAGSNPIEAGSVHRYLLLLRRVYAELISLGCLSKNPVTAAILKAYPEDRIPAAVLTPGEVDQLTEMLRQLPGWKGCRDRAIAALLLGAGLRVGELQQASLDAFDQDSGRFFVPRQGPVFAHDTIILPDWIEFYKPWLEHRAELVIPGDRLIPASLNGKAITTSGLFRRISTWFELAGISPERGGGEILRNTFGRTALAIHTPGDVQEFMGLETARAVSRYS